MQTHPERKRTRRWLPSLQLQLLFKHPKRLQRLDQLLRLDQVRLLRLSQADGWRDPIMLLVLLPCSSHLVHDWTVNQNKAIINDPVIRRSTLRLGRPSERREIRATLNKRWLTATGGKLFLWKPERPGENHTDMQTPHRNEADRFSRDSNPGPSELRHGHAKIR